jgi:hypothetical protein
LPFPVLAEKSGLGSHDFFNKSLNFLIEENNHFHCRMENGYNSQVHPNNRLKRRFWHPLYKRPPRPFPWQISPQIDQNIIRFLEAAAGPLNWPILF